jgi:hypothetical protein
MDVMKRESKKNLEFGRKENQASTAFDLEERRYSCWCSSTWYLQQLWPSPALIGCCVWLAWDLRLALGHWETAAQEQHVKWLGSPGAMPPTCVVWLAGRKRGREPVTAPNAPDFYHVCLAPPAARFFWMRWLLRLGWTFQCTGPPPSIVTRPGPGRCHSFFQLLLRGGHGHPLLGWIG